MRQIIFICPQLAPVYRSSFFETDERFTRQGTVVLMRVAECGSVSRFGYRSWCIMLAGSCLRPSLLIAQIMRRIGHFREDGCFSTAAL
jgi:hypothetical protein